jgi:hypothetical protein
MWSWAGRDRPDRERTDDGRQAGMNPFARAIEELDALIASWCSVHVDGGEAEDDGPTKHV